MSLSFSLSLTVSVCCRTLSGKELHESEHYEYTRDEEREVYGLHIHTAVLEDAGKLTFTASNAAGSESGFCVVEVHSEC